MHFPRYSRADRRPPHCDRPTDTGRPHKSRRGSFRTVGSRFVPRPENARPIRATDTICFFGHCRRIAAAETTANTFPVAVVKSYFFSFFLSSQVPHLSPESSRKRVARGRDQMARRLRVRSFSRGGKIKIWRSPLITASRDIFVSQRF